jgi:hypothetical protein
MCSNRNSSAGSKRFLGSTGRNIRGIPDTIGQSSAIQKALSTTSNEKGQRVPRLLFAPAGFSNHRDAASPEEGRSVPILGDLATPEFP